MLLKLACAYSTTLTTLLNRKDHIR